MQENEGVCQVLGAGSVRMVDVPGHERSRSKLDKHLKDAKAIVFVLDAADITPHKAEAAEELFEILTHPTASRRKVPLLIACNKMDLDTQAHSLEFIRKTLEKQLDAMRKTRTTLSPEAKAKAAVLGKPEKPFKLSGLRNKITIAPMSALKGDISAIYSFLKSGI
ncbi:hypothetical protein CEUSTIGMA_g3569.t1 [Chlamydomonas eustigma]|uniref:Signal recognition particle receptor subunit beta n=1 Tax=Chlamydomonas eustigma TaxID=1157962 RepID=A0A250WZB8_9CHLO|nr:hypothetical protein CEUSTIGMA_g3569.t1 [Chlamydomonas eustigma]|eukprot:GAX76126.1 hypothetical protein CEUSTIGMA_g3569.t1 [Chlamydomonas eustigma]